MCSRPRKPAGSSILFFFQAEDGIRDYKVTGVQTCALPISYGQDHPRARDRPAQAGAPRLPEDLAVRRLVPSRRARRRRGWRHGGECEVGAHGWRPYPTSVDAEELRRFLDVAWLDPKDRAVTTRAGRDGLHGGDVDPRLREPAHQLCAGSGAIVPFRQKAGLGTDHFELGLLGRRFEGDRIGWHKIELRATVPREPGEGQQIYAGIAKPAEGAGAFPCLVQSRHFEV